MTSSRYKVRSFQYRNGASSRRIRENTGDSIPLDLTENPYNLLVNIFKNIGNKAGTGNTKNLGHLNNLIIILSNCDDVISEFSLEDVMLCLKPALVSDVKEVRAACIRALRYLINDAASVGLLTKLHLDCFIIKCLDISHFNEVERIQCLRLVRKIFLIAKIERQSGNRESAIIPKSFALCVMSISSDGAVERDRVYRTCLAILCELVVLEPLLVIENGGILVLLRAILECHMYRRINEALCISLGILLNHPASRNLLTLDFNFSAIFAPYTDIMYRLHADVEESQIREEKEMRFSASKMAIVSVLRSWSGLLHLCQGSSIKSFLNTLLIPDSGIKHATFSVLFEVFCMNEPIVSSDFPEALRSIGPKVYQESWQLSNNFVVGEGKWFLPSLCNERLNLTNCYMAILLAIFIEANIIQHMVDVIMSNDEEASITASIFLGGLLHMCSKLHSVPHAAEMWGENATRSYNDCLPNLMKRATSKSSSKEEILRASVAVSRLQRIHDFLKKPPSSHSVYYDELILRIKASGIGPHDTLPQSSSHLSVPGSENSFTMDNGNADNQEGTLAILRRNRSIAILRSFSSEQTIARIKETKVLSEKDFRKWDWEAVTSFLMEGWTKKSASFTEPRFIGSDDTEFQFMKKLVLFYTPNEGEFHKAERAKDSDTDKETPVKSGCHLIRYLSYAAGEGMRALNTLLENIVAYLSKMVKETDGMKKATSSYLSSCAREYFLLLGSITMWNHGNEILKRNGVFKFFHSLVNDSSPVHESLLKLIVSSLSYSSESESYKFLKKVLVSANDNARLYATSYLRILLRSKMPGFISWGVNLLITQLYDASQNVATEVLDIISEACSDQEYLNVIVSLRPHVLHLEKGALLVCRFASHPTGFEYLLNGGDYLSKELDRWWETANERYVTRVEEMLNNSLTCFEKPNQQGSFVRRSGIKKVVQPVHVPSHLYGELCQHPKGCELLEERNIIPRLVEKLNSALAIHNSFSNTAAGFKFSLVSYQRISEQLINIKSCLWALCHIGSSILGLELIERDSVIAIIQDLAEHSPIYSIRGTCFYCLSVISQTVSGAERLKRTGWQSTLRKVWTGTTSLDSESESRVYKPLPSPSRSAHSEKSSLSAMSSFSHRTSSPTEKSSASFNLKIESGPKSDSSGIYDHKNRSEISTTKIQITSPEDEVFVQNFDNDACCKCFDGKPITNSLENIFCKRCGSKRMKASIDELNPGKLERRISLSTPTIVGKTLGSHQNLESSVYDDGERYIGSDSPQESWCFNKIEDLSAMKYLVERFTRYKNQGAYHFPQEPDSIDRPMVIVSDSVQKIIEESMGFVGIAVPDNISRIFEKKSPASSSEAPIISLLEGRLKSKSFAKHSKYFSDPDDSKSPSSVQSTTSAMLEDMALQGGSQTEAMHREILKLVSNLGSSIGRKADETALLIIKEKFPKAFDSTTLYYSVSEILGGYNFRLTARRFIQELFHDMAFGEVFDEARETLKRYEAAVRS